MQQYIETLLRQDEHLQILTETDLLPDDSFGVRWLAVTDQRVLVADLASGGNGRSETPKVAAEYDLASIEAVHTVHHVGKVSIELDLEARRERLISCTNALSGRFSKIAAGLNAHCKDGKPLDLSLDEDDRRQCESCGRLLPDSNAICPACLKKGQVLKRFWGYMKPHWPKLALMGACVFASTILALAPPYLTKLLVDEAIQGSGGRSLLLLLVLGLAGARILGSGISIAQGRVAAWLGSRIIHDVRFDFYQAVQGLSLRRFDKTQTGSLLARLTHDTQMLNFFFVEVGAFFVPVTLQLIGIIIMLFVLDWRLAALVIAPSPILVFLTIVFFRRLRRFYHRLWQRRSKMTSRANDAIAGIRVVKAFSQELREVDMFRARSEELAGATARAESLHATYFPILGLITMGGSFLVWYFGGLGVMQGTGLSLGDLMAFLGYLGMFYRPLQQMTRFTDWMNRAFTAAQRLFEVTDSDQEVYEDPDAQALNDPKGLFEFENVEFGYLKDRPVLKGLDARVEPGEMIGLVGRSGVGKTTLTNLICRFYDVDEGAIKLDGIDIRKLRLRDLRRHIGIVPQESYLFDGSILENIGYAKPDATREDVMRAAMAANAHGFIMRLPDGYETRVGERGTRLSGGEKQRVAIARAILHDPKILILDEATSAMDTETEELIQRALSNLIAGRTTFAIAHRLSTLRNANRLLVVDEGKVAEFGPHDELLEQKGIYHRLVEMQSRLSAIRAVDG